MERLRGSANRPLRRLSRSVMVVGAIMVAATCGDASARQGLRTTSGVAPESSTIVEPGLPGQAGVVTFVRLRAPAGMPKSLALTGQRLRSGAQMRLCLYASQMTSGKHVGSSTGTCPGPLPLVNRPLVIVVTAGWCTPAPVELVWGLAARNATVSLTVPGTTVRTSRVPVPVQFDPHASLYYGFVHGGPVHVVVREDTGRTSRKLVNAHSAPFGCNRAKIGPAPTSDPPYETGGV